VHCDLNEMDRRERVRGDRRIGEGRTHVQVDGIHTFGPYDLDVDTTAGVDADLADRILTAWRQRTPHNSVLSRSASTQEPRGSRP
jgi:chloramphenicol 3-O phosphotransferase